MLKAHNTRLKVELYHLKTNRLFTELVEDVRDAGFIARWSFCWDILSKKL